jgi:hypothetical protein
MKVNSKQLNGFTADSLKICLLQLESPFDEILEKTWRPGGHFFAPIQKNEDKYKQRITRLAAMLSTLQSSGQRIDVLVLPEYAFLKNDAQLTNNNIDTLDFLRRYCETAKTIIVGNCYDSTRRLSETFVIIPSGHFSTAAPFEGPSMVAAYKVTRSRYDMDTLADLTPDMETVLRLEWHSATTPSKMAYIQILTCKDFLYFTSLVPLRNHPDVIRLDRACPKRWDFGNIIIRTYDISVTA